jgi:hypothetical protein
MIQSFKSLYPKASVRKFAAQIAARMNIEIVEETGECVIDAEINAARLTGSLGWQGRWIARCPTCSGAEYVDPGDPVFICLSCFNSEHGNKLLSVRFPERRQEIEAALEPRPAQNRNWLPGETVEDILAENSKHGYGV